MDAEFIGAQRRPLTAAAAEATSVKNSIMTLRKVNGWSSVLVHEQDGLSWRHAATKRAGPRWGRERSEHCEVAPSGRAKRAQGGIDNARRLDNRDYVRERRVRRWFEEAIIFCYRMTLLLEPFTLDRQIAN